MPKDESPPADPVTALGERILAELGAERTNDTLTRWLAHHVARLIDAADRARRDGSADADTRAAEAHEAILHLWEARTTWPTGWPPPRAAKIAQILDDLPDLDNHDRQPSRTLLGQLQNLHHRILAALVDLAISSEPNDLEQAWLDSTGDRLTTEETALLRRAASSRDRIETSLPRWFQELAGEVDPIAGGVEPEEQDTYSLDGAAEAYRTLVSEFVTRVTARAEKRSRSGT